MPQNITIKMLLEMSEKTDRSLTYRGLTARLRQMEEAGCPVEEHYGKRGIRWFTPEDAERALAWRGKKPGRKRI